MVPERNSRNWLSPFRTWIINLLNFIHFPIQHLKIFKIAFERKYRQMIRPPGTLRKEAVMRFCWYFIVAGFFLSVTGVNPTPAQNKANKGLPFGTQLWQYNFYGICATDINNVWVSGNFGTIAYSNDGGTVWKEQQTKVSTELYDITFLNEKTGWCVGRHGVILKTADGGRTWIKKNSGPMETLLSVCFINAEQGWAAGDQNTIIHTNDGGQSWFDQSERTERILKDITFIDEQYGWVVGEFGVIFHTTDGGINWINQENPLGEHTLFSVFFKNRLDGWVVGMDGCILHTADGGKTWKALKSPIHEHLFEIQIMGENGWATGLKGHLCISKDGGLTWTSAPGKTDVNVWLRRVHFIDSQNGFLCGATGAIRYTRDGKNWHTPKELIVE